MKRLLQSTLSRVVLAALVVLLTIAVVGASILTVIENRVEDRVHAAAAASGLAVAWEDFTLMPWGELYLDEVVVKRGGVRVAQFEELEVDVRLLSRRLFSERPIVESVEATGGVVAPSAALLGMHVGAGAAGADSPSARGRALRDLFGDTPPHIELEDVTVETAHLGGPAKHVTIEHFETELDDGAWRGEGRLSLQGQSEAFELPAGASIAAMFFETERGWQQGPLRMGFDSPLTMRYRGHELTARAVSLDEKLAVTLEDVAIDSAILDSIVTADAVQVSPITAVFDQSFDEIEELRVEQPRIEVPRDLVEALLQRPSGPAEDDAGARRSWNDALDRTWTRAFEFSERVLTRLDASLPPVLIVDDAQIIVTGQDAAPQASLHALHMLFVSGDRAPRFSVRTELSLDGEAMGRFTLSTSGGPTAKIIGRVENLDARMLQDQLAARALWPETMTMTGVIDFELEATEDPAGVHPFAGGIIVHELAVFEPRVALDPVVFKRASYQFEGRHSPQARVADPTIISHRTGYATLPESERRGAIEIEGYEMLKGLAGIATHEHLEKVPIVENSQDYVALAHVIENVIRDNPGLHGIYLRRHGLYTWGATLADAVRYLETEKLDLVLSDIKLRGEGDGTDVAREAAKHGVKVLFVSGNCPIEARSLAVGCLAKPYSEKTLKAALEALDLAMRGKAVKKLPAGLSLYDQPQ